MSIIPMYPSCSNFLSNLSLSLDLKQGTGHFPAHSELNDKARSEAQLGARNEGSAVQQGSLDFIYSNWMGYHCVRACASGLKVSPILSRWVRLGEVNR